MRQKISDPRSYIASGKCFRINVQFDGEWCSAIHKFVDGQLLSWREHPINAWSPSAWTAPDIAKQGIVTSEDPETTEAKTAAFLSAFGGERRARCAFGVHDVTGASIVSYAPDADALVLSLHCSCGPTRAFRLTAEWVKHLASSLLRAGEPRA